EEERSGPLKTGVDTVKEAVKTVINKFHQVPVKLLKYVDRKKVSTQARSVVTEVRRAGVEEERSGPLKTGVDTVKEAVKTVINKFHQVPVKLLKYVDHKKVSTQARSVVTEIRRAGVVESASGLAKTVYSKYEPKAEAPPLF
ncbi:hypothetical protein RYX36_012904, partial [Vicia faba]